jgi:hypothetical protein
MITWRQFLETNDHELFAKLDSFFGREKELFRYDPSIPDKKLLQNIEFIRRDPRFAQYDDMQIERMLMHHDPQEVLRYGPEECLSRANDLSFRDQIDLDF